MKFYFNIMMPSDFSVAPNLIFATGLLHFRQKHLALHRSITHNIDQDSSLSQLFEEQSVPKFLSITVLRFDSDLWCSGCVPHSRIPDHRATNADIL
jgi:hypothetical protein